MPPPGGVTIPTSPVVTRRNCDAFFSRLFLHQRAQQTHQKRVYGVVLIEKRGSGLCILCRGESGLALREAWRLNSPDSPQLPLYELHDSSGLRWPFIRRGA
jgi:hypothetical protein